MIYNQFIKTFTITALNTQCSAGSDAFYLQGLFARSVVTMSIDGHQENSATHQIEKTTTKKRRGFFKKRGGGKKRGEKIPAVQFDRE